MKGHPRLVTRNPLKLIQVLHPQDIFLTGEDFKSSTAEFPKVTLTQAPNHFLAPNDILACKLMALLERMQLLDNK
jgi:hypothetical protein